MGGMGCSEKYFTGAVGEWIEKGWLPLRGRIIDFGSQEFVGDVENTRADVSKFLSGIPGAREPSELTVSAVFQAAGFEYVSIDVDGQRGSQYFDLNSFAVPRKYHGRFDFVNNEGTIEHLVNPINGFHAAHDLTKLYGVIRHSMPLIGWKEHGFFYPTVKFYATLIGENRYELLQARMSIQSVNESFGDALVREIRDETGGQRLAFADAWIHLAYRKTADKPFEIPADHLPLEAAGRIVEGLRKNYRKLARRRRTP